ncbi:hypothetical protein [Sphingobacterium cavernae]|uniref:hypothetical protein n=1 Tax=Sphingobacterium cavernae TaxID=2592657 RepID=UPI00122FD02B|nr:hypothetical protein [Sphingobacterium cavernae]
MKRKLNRNIFIYIGCFAALAFVFSKVTNYLIYSDTPSFILQAYEELKKDDGVIQAIGKVEDYEYSYNVNDINNDTIPFSITVLGNREKIYYECKAIKSPEDSIFNILYNKL